MSSEGVKSLLDAIDPDYEEERIRQMKEEAIAAQKLAAQPSTKQTAFRRGYEFLTRTKLLTPKEIADRKSKFLNDYIPSTKGLIESIQTQNIVNFRLSIDDFLDYVDEFIDFKNKYNRDIKDTTGELLGLINKITNLLQDSDDFYTKNIGRTATQTNSSNSNRIEKMLNNLNAKPRASPPPPPPAVTPPPPPPPAVPPPPPPAVKTCEEKLAFFNITDRPSYRAWMLVYHPDRNPQDNEETNRKIIEYIRDYNSNINSVDQVYADIKDCVDSLGLQYGGGKTRKKKKHNKKTHKKGGSLKQTFNIARNYNQ